jgi:hypothetical protein
MKYYVETTLLAIMVALMYKTPNVLSRVSNTIVFRALGVLSVYLLQMYFGLNAGILGVGVFLVIMYNKQLSNVITYKDVESDEGFDTVEGEIGVNNLDPVDKIDKDKYSMGTISRRNMVDLDRKFKKEAERKKFSAASSLK